MHLRVVTEETLDMQWQATPLNTEAASVSEAPFNGNWAMRCRVQSKECSSERTNRKKLKTPVLCWTVHAVLCVDTGSVRERNKE